MIVSLSMVQSEADIIEYFIRSNVKLLDHMFVILNPSEDGTADILDDLVREGLPLTVWPTRKNHYAQSEVLSALANRIRDQLDPDYLCLLDADEILLAHSREAFEASLGRIEPGSVGLVPWVTFVPPNNEQSYVFRPRQWKSRLGHEVSQYYKVVVPRHAAQGGDVIIPNGQHIALEADGKNIPTSTLDDLPLAHLPVRSIPQVMTKTYNALISKGLAQGPSWRGAESFQRQTVLSYFESRQAPDAREIAHLYLANNCGEQVKPQCVGDIRLPNEVQLYSDHVQQKTPELQLLHRIMHSVYPLPDPTEALLQRHTSEAVRTESNPKGIFSSSFHAQNLKCDWPPFAYVEKRFHPSSILDVGCGLGAYLSLFRASGAEVLGIDGAPWSNDHYVAADQYRRVDLSAASLEISGKYSASIFVEVAEHLPEEAGIAIIDEIASKTTDVIIFSAAQPDQPGYAHITLRKPEFWLQRFQQHGWNVDVSGSISLRMLSTLHWFRRNLFLLVRREQPCASSLQKLLRLGVHHDENGGSNWPTHRNGETIIGFPGQRWSFTMTGDREIPPLRNSNPEISHKALLAQVREAEAQATTFRKNVASLTSQNQAQLSGVHEEILKLRAQRALAEEQLAAIQASTSWRATVPLRGLGRILKRFR